MGGFLEPQTFNPPVAPISLGTSGQVLEMVGGRPKFTAASGGGGGIGGTLAFASPSGTIDPSITGFIATAGTSGTGRLLVTLSAATSWEGLPQGADGQQLFVSVIAGAFPLTFLHLDASTAQAQILASSDFMIALNDTLGFIYTASLGEWELIA